jgi:hypothetical protein
MGPPWRYPDDFEAELPEVVRIRPGDRGGVLSFDEAKALHEQGVFGRQSLDLGDRIAISGWALSAFDTYLADTYEAWLTYRDRLAAGHELRGPLVVVQVALPKDGRTALEQAREKYDGDKSGWRPRAETYRGR